MSHFCSVDLSPPLSVVDRVTTVPYTRMKSCGFLGTAAEIWVCVKATLLKFKPWRLEPPRSPYRTLNLLGWDHQMAENVSSSPVGVVRDTQLSRSGNVQRSESIVRVVSTLV
jgi:hypothetical protein